MRFRIICGELYSFLNIYEVSLLLFFLSLVGNRFHQLTDFFGITQEIVFFQIQFVTELKYVRDGSRQIQFYDLFIGDVLQVLDDAAQTISVSFRDSVRGSSASGTS